MEGSMLSFVLAHLPDAWTPVPSYTKPHLLFTLSPDDDEYHYVEPMFYGASVKQIIRVQNPFQYGRYMLRCEMVQSSYEGIVFHGVHKDNLDVALKSNCDFRQYEKRNDGIYENLQQPMFYDSFSDLLKKTVHHITDINVLVLQILTKQPKTQCDYFIQYVVKF